MRVDNYDGEARMRRGAGLLTQLRYGQTEGVLPQLHTRSSPAPEPTGCRPPRGDDMLYHLERGNG